MFFLVVASLQGLYGLGLLVGDGRLARSPWYLLGGILGTLLVIEVYVISRTLGIPLVGPHAGHVEAVGTLDLLSQAGELGLVAALAAMLARIPTFRPSFRAGAILATVAFLTLAAALLISGLATRERPEPSVSIQEPTPGASTPALPTFQALYPLLLRMGDGPRGTSADVIYAPPILFQAQGIEVPRETLERPTLIFRLVEADHEHELGLTAEPPQAVVRLDGGGAIAPYQVSVIAVGEGHRTADYFFPMPEGMSQGTLDRGAHSLTFAFPVETGGESTFSWRLPLEGLDAAPQPAQEDALPVTALSQLLTKSSEALEYRGIGGIKVKATYATPEYFKAAFPSEVAGRYLPDEYIVFAVTERLHTADLSKEPLPVSLRLEGRRQYQPDMVEPVVSSAHHRITLVRFPVAPPSDNRHRVMELTLPGEAKLEWHLPISYGSAAANTEGPALGWAAILAILGGMVAAMWPCLFQLTVFFIPTMAGIGMQEASGAVKVGRRLQVVKAAFFFVLGFTLVYTVAGALIGYAAQQVGGTDNFTQWQRYLGIGGGVVILALALRTAAKVRAPLVCKMPVLSKMAHNPKPANPLELMVAGLAFATGCMTCFGAALVVSMVVFVGLSGSVGFGALILFLFSLGMGIPLVIAATAMAKVLPLLFRMEKVIPWMGLAASLLMAGFAVLLITGQYMVLTEWVYRLLPATVAR
jgi:cytochrome c-type biogenesis protein